MRDDVLFQRGVAVLYRLVKSFKVAIAFGVMAALSVVFRLLIRSTGKPVDWSPILATAGRAFGIYAAVMFVLVFTGIMKPRSEPRKRANVNPWFWGLFGVGAIAVVVWVLT